MLDVIDMTIGNHKSYMISVISVPRPHQRKGVGNMLLMKCTDQADAEKAILTLRVAPYGDMSYRQLVRWYKKHGFVKDRYGSGMRRDPKPLSNSHGTYNKEQAE